MKKIALILLTGWLSIGLFWGGLPMAAALASPQPTGMASAAIDNTAPFSVVDDFLQSIPRDYYAVPQIGALKGMLQDKTALLIDVREPSEFRRGHIPGAMNMPLRSLTDNLDTIPRIVLSCCTVPLATAQPWGSWPCKCWDTATFEGFHPVFKGGRQAVSPSSPQTELTLFCLPCLQ
jgi:hypothetical protein